MPLKSMVSSTDAPDPHLPLCSFITIAWLKSDKFYIYLKDWFPSVWPRKQNSLQKKKLRDGRKGRSSKSIEITSLFPADCAYLYFHFFTEKMILILIEPITFTLQLVNKTIFLCINAIESCFNRVIDFCTAVSGVGNSCYCGVACFFRWGVYCQKQGHCRKSEHINPV